MKKMITTKKENNEIFSMKIKFTQFGLPKGLGDEKKLHIGNG